MVSKRDIEKAYEVISKNIVCTPVSFSYTFSDICGCRTYFKLENFQMTGSFKDRGSLNKLLAVSAGAKARGVITASAGNHAQGVAYHSQRLKIPSKIVMPVGTPLIKVVSTQNYGAEVVLYGDTYDDAYEHALEISENDNLAFIHPFNDPYVIAGQGTIGVEILNNPMCKELDAIVCPVGGGGLISGIATYIKETNPSIKIIGVETELFSSMKDSLNAGHIKQTGSGSSLADGIAVKKPGDITYSIAQKYVDDVVTVNEDEIANALMLLLEIEKVVVEGAGAVPVAALINKKVNLAGKNVLSIISGGNIDVNIVNRIITRGLLVDGRIVQTKVRVHDTPGALTSALEKLKHLRANVLEIIHHRFDSSTPIGFVDISITLETKGHQHIKEIMTVLAEKNYLV